VAQSAEGEQTQIIQSITGVIDAFADPAGLINAIANPATQLITLTITEKGYGLSPGTRCLDTDNPDILADMSGLEYPRSAPGFLVAGLAARFRRHGTGLTVLSCDNLSDNGELTRNSVLALARTHSTELHDWIANEVTFPNAMVDRIAPAVTSASLMQVETLLGVSDAAAVFTEQFSQWVIEDHFAGARPHLDRAGATFVSSVANWERRKLRLLNAAHSTLACVGSWLGLRYVHQAMAQPQMAALIDQLWLETGATLEPDQQFDLEAYLKDLRHRFNNPHLAHALAQIVSDSSQKLPQRIFAPIQERLDQGLPVAALTTAVAGWMCIQEGVAINGLTIDFSDPLQGQLRAALASKGDCHETRAAAIIDAYPPLQTLCTHLEWRQRLIATYAALKQGQL
jgi:fructuronate reductase